MTPAEDRLMMFGMLFTPVALSALPVISTLVGGLVVYRWKKDLHPWLSLSGGILLGVAFLDLLPEALDRGLAHHLDIKWMTGITLLAILLFHFLDKILSFHAHHHHQGGIPKEPCDNDQHDETRTFVRASSMVLHSLLDGVAIGAGFAVDFHLGLLVTFAVIMHDFSDGMSTVTILKSGLGDRHRAILPFLIADAIAPFAGSMIGSAVGLPDVVIAGMLALFSGFFIFLALADLLPQAHAGTMSRKFGLFLTTLGIIMVAVIQKIISI